MKNLLKATCVMCCLLVGFLPVFAQRMDVSDDVNVKIEQAQENAYLASSNFSYEFGQSLVYFGGGVAVFGASAFIAQAIIQSPDASGNTNPPSTTKSTGAPVGPPTSVPILPAFGTIGLAAGGAIALIGGICWWVGKAKLADNGGKQYLGNQRGFSARFDLAGSLVHPISVDMAYGYHFNDYLYLGAGVGGRFFGTASIPLYGEFGYSILKKRVSPFIGLKGGAAFDVTTRANNEPVASGYFCVDLGTQIRHREKDSGKGDWKITSYFEGYINRDINFGLKVGYSF